MFSLLQKMIKSNTAPEIYTNMICTPAFNHESYSCFETVRTTSSYFHLSKKKKKKKKTYYCFIHSLGALVTSMLPLGLPPSPLLLQAPALFQATLFHLNFNPIYSLSFPPACPPAWGHQTIHPADFMSPSPVIKTSVGICVQETVWLTTHHSSNSARVDSPILCVCVRVKVKTWSESELSPLHLSPDQRLSTLAQVLEKFWQQNTGNSPSWTLRI